MKHLLALFALLFSLVFFSACEKSDDPDTGAGGTNCRATTIYQTEVKTKNPSQVSRDTIRVTYTPDGRMERVSHTLGNFYWEYTYSPKLITHSLWDNGKVCDRSVYHLNTQGLAVQEDWDLICLPQKQTLFYQYDAAGHLIREIRVQYGDGDTTTYIWQNGNRVQSINKSGIETWEYYPDLEDPFAAYNFPFLGKSSLNLVKTHTDRGGNKEVHTYFWSADRLVLDEHIDEYDENGVLERKKDNRYVFACE